MFSLSQFIANHTIKYPDNFKNEVSFFFGGSKNEQERANKVATLQQLNKRTIYTFSSIVALLYAINSFFLFAPKIKSDSFDLHEPDTWHLVILNLLPLFFYCALLRVLNEINKPISDNAKLGSKNEGLLLSRNEFVGQLNILFLLMVFSQTISLLNEQVLWSNIIIVSLWCYILSSKVGRGEHERLAPITSKPWIKLARSPKIKTPLKVTESVSTVKNQHEANHLVRDTPRTRTKRAVKNMLHEVSDKYHAFEQNVAQSIAQNIKIFDTSSPKMKMIEKTHD